MKLQGVFDSQEGYGKVYKDLLERFKVNSLYDIDRKVIFEEFEKTPGYAHAMYRGKLKNGVELTELELAMICDSGYSFFGGQSNIYENKKTGAKTFMAKIHTD